MDEPPLRVMQNLYIVSGRPAFYSQFIRRTMTITGNTPQTNVVHNQLRETYSVADARAAMGIDWMPMKCLSQAIPPAYAEWIGREVLSLLGIDSHPRPDLHSPPA